MFVQWAVQKKSKIGRVPIGKNSFLTVLITPEDVSKKIRALQLRKPLEAIRSLREKERAFATNVIKKIFQVINGSARPEELTYLASREALIGSKSSKVSYIRRIAPIVALTIQHNISSNIHS